MKNSLILSKLDLKPMTLSEMQVVSGGYKISILPLKVIAAIVQTIVKTVISLTGR